MGFGIAALAAAGVFAMTVFGSGHGDWMLRAAQQQAVRCLTSAACVEVTGEGKAVTHSRPPISPDSRCARKKNWHARASVLVQVVTCSGERTYLYHMGRFDGAGTEQWMVCAKPDCAREAAIFAEK